jgi:cell division septation protein DedD
VTNHKENPPEDSISRWSRSEPASDSGTAEGGGRREPGFGNFQDTTLEEYEEPERDNDYFSGYNNDEGLEEENEDLLPSWEGEQPGEQTAAPEPVEEDERAEEGEPEEPAEWLDEEEYFEPEGGEPAMPLRLIAVAAVALLLLVVGAYGVLQERAGMQEELTELRASLGTGVKESDVREARDAVRELQQSYDALAAEASALSQENLELKEIIAALEGAQAGTGAEKQAPVTKEQTASAPAAPPPAATRKEPPPPAPAPQPVAAKKPAPTQPKTQATASAPTGPWFVNFSSYSSRATAQSWAAKLSPVQGEVVVVPGTKDNRTYYRVRVVGLSDKRVAEVVARQLEAELNVSRLWVGQE